MEHREVLWRQYQQHIDTYKFYLEIVIKLIGFYFAISGAMLSFYFSNAANESAKYSLYLPLFMGLGLLTFFVIGAVLSLITRKDVFEIRDELGLRTSPELGVLTLLLIIFSAVLTLSIGGIGYVLLR
jgi:cytochrome bd-type quinol oxidase subunit 1